MRAKIRDRDALLAVSPAALSAWARAAGWTKTESYGEHSDVYAAQERPEVILPRTQRLGDYANVVARLIEIFAADAERDELSLYRDLVIADRDTIRIKAAESNDGSMSLNDGVQIVQGSRDLLLAAACSLREPQMVYRAGANKEANELLSRVRLGQTEQGSFVVTLLTAPISVPMQLRLFPDYEIDDESDERRMTRHLVEVLDAALSATEGTVAGNGSAFSDAIEKGVSANLCEALVNLIEPFPKLDVTVSWAWTHPRNAQQHMVCFANSDVAILRNAAQTLRSREPQPDAKLFGFVHQLKRDDVEIDGLIHLKTQIDGKNCSVATVLKQTDYLAAIDAHKKQMPIILQGDLERTSRRWRLLNPRLVGVIDQNVDESEKTSL